MKLMLQIKLLPDKEQSSALLDTLKTCNIACNDISTVAWENQVFNQFKLQHLTYYKIKSSLNLSAQVVVRCISKVCDAYKKDRNTKRIFKPLGGITYDNRILSYKATTVSIWSVNGRLRIPFICHNPKYMPYIKGEADLVYRNNKFYLFQTVEVPEDDIRNVEKFIGVDFGITNIATLSDGTIYGSEQLNKIRDRYFKTRRSVQRKGTLGAKKLLKRLRGREQRFATITNHTIAKQVVRKAKALNMGIAIENLTYIRDRAKVRKSQRRRHHSWAFAQLRAFLAYKSQLNGVLLVVVNPKNTSKTCSACGCFGNRKGILFTCSNCGNVDNADLNAALNIAQLGLSVNQPEKRTELIA